MQLAGHLRARLHVSARRSEIPLRGLIADTCEPNGDSDWALLLAPGWGRV
jgi:hypothetical protein